ncbi:MAG: PocR ligand-binding domain-containing protein [Clostridiaceae bacterium]
MNNDLNNTGFDIEKARNHAGNYTRATGMYCTIINSRGESLQRSCGDSGICAFCRNIQNNPKKNKDCANVHLYGSYQSERFDGKYVFFCPLGLVHWASPIVNDGIMKGALIGGPVLMLNPEEFLLEELIREYGTEESELDEIKKYVKDVPVVQPDVVNSLSELLCIVAESISTNSPRLEGQRDYYKLQADISDAVQQIKLSEYSHSSTYPYPFEKEKELLSKIALGDKPSSQKILNEIFGYIFFSSGKDFNIIKARVLELAVLLSRAAVEGGADIEEVFGLNLRYLSDIHTFKTVEELCFWLSNIMSRFTDCVFNLADVRHKDTIYKALDYIKRNFSKRITLEEVAGQVYLNPSYFSKIFKSEMNTTFVSYVNKIRINAAKNLLSDISIPLTDISCMVGFEDQSYFTKVFKKATGVTPGKYRESKGQA